MAKRLGIRIGSGWLKSIRDFTKTEHAKEAVEWSDDPKAQPQSAGIWLAENCNQLMTVLELDKLPHVEELPDPSAKPIEGAARTTVEAGGAVVHSAPGLEAAIHRLAAAVEKLKS
jgi:hypothetical protein